MRKIGLLILFLFSQTIAAQNICLLFFQEAKKGTFVENKDHTYTLTLNNVHKDIRYFSNRPVRKAGVLSLKEFFYAWNNPHIKNNFKQDPPNAAIVMTTDKGNVQDLVGLISAYTYEKDHISYTIKVISREKPMQLGSVSSINVFFDDFNWEPGGFGPDG